jgi:glucosamine--fructose-6-phosphate aminotransferase (isomerizing)
MLVSRRMASGLDADEAFRETVASFEGSVAIAASIGEVPDALHLALRGSGQALYIGLAEDAFVVASEPYGVVEETARYVRMDGDATGGQVVVLDRGEAGHLGGIRRFSYSGDRLPVHDDEVQTAEITTRDIDRAGFPHFLLKEISEAPLSFRKTLRGKVVEVDGRLTVRLGDDTLPPALREKLRDGRIRRIVTIGQGTAAVAGESVANSLSRYLSTSGIAVRAQLAAELSGFGLLDDMSDTLVVAISQSGTTTDTNRTVDLVRGRDATVISIVNRRSSDLAEKSHGVLYTSDGRDVEMAVPSTKAFYAQVAAGFLLALALAEEAGCGDERETHDILSSLRTLPDAMEEVLAGRESIAQAAHRYAPERRYWAIVGNGPNRIAAEELRIKLSELCYKAIACDSTEDKKHIDLSSEPMILVCATGLDASTAGDVAKEVAIYRAHKAAPIVIASRGTSFPAALQTIEVPEVHPSLAFVLSAMAGHLFGYEAALAIDAQALPLREVRASIEAVASSARSGVDPLVELGPLAARSAAPFLAGLRGGAYNGHLEAATAVRLVQLLGYTTGALPIEAYEAEYGKVGTPSALISDLTDAVTDAIDELTRPIDAIKHQAKTVTVGISRSEDALLTVPLVAETLAAGAPRDRLSYRALRTLAALDAAVEEVTGYTRYQIEGSIADRTATIHVIDKGGVARELTSRTESNPALRGIKHRAAEEREVTVGLGGRDHRTLVLVPEVKDNQPTGMTLLHVRFAEHLPVETMRTVLSGYRNRYAAIVDAVTEVEPSFDDALLDTLPVIDVLTVPVHVLAERWREGSPTG